MARSNRKRKAPQKPEAPAEPAVDGAAAADGEPATGDTPTANGSDKSPRRQRPARISKKHVRLVYAALVIVNVLVYIQVLGHDFVHFDDNVYIFENGNVRAGLHEDTIKWALTSGDASNWHPITWLSLMLDSTIYGEGRENNRTLNPAGFHFTNLLLHVINTLLLLHVLRRFTGRFWASAFVAALFALHPLHVESVAWCTERKDVLFLLFGLLGMLAYLRYVESTQKLWYAICAVMLVFSLMSKPMLVTFPCVLLLLDFWPLGRYRFAPAPEGNRQLLKLAKAGELARSNGMLILEKLPLFAVVLGSAMTTVFVQGKGGAVAAIEKFSMSIRVMNATVAYVKYIWLTIYPTQLAFFYPHPGDSLSTWHFAGALALLIVVTVVVCLYWRRAPWLIVGWLWFLGTMVPVIGILQVGKQSMADRYTYWPHIGLFAAVTWAVATRATAPSARKVLAVVAGVLLAVCAVLSTRQAAIWKNDTTLCEHALQVTNCNYKALNNLAVRYEDKGDDLRQAGEEAAAIAEYERALTRFTDALACDVDHTRHYNIGNVYRKLQRFDEALAAYQEALRLHPSYARTHNNIGSIYFKNYKNYPMALKHFQLAAEADTGLSDGPYNLGVALFTMAGNERGKGNEAAALELYRQARNRFYDARKAGHRDAPGMIDRINKFLPAEANVQRPLLTPPPLP
ncbi:MAG: tetratricopeptide repeat protein [Lentisphaeria bacterium]|nr:tetratricopeptide repeat protein [Lentisphaeria bacterium]